MAWALLRKLIEDNEEENSTLIRKSVVNKLLKLNAFVPQWLHDAYKVIFHFCFVLKITYLVYFLGS